MRVAKRNYEPTMTFFDFRLSESSGKAPPDPHNGTTPEKVQRLTHDDDDFLSLGSYTGTKLIPKKDKIVKELKIQHEFEMKG